MNTFSFPDAGADLVKRGTNATVKRRLSCRAFILLLLSRDRLEKKATRIKDVSVTKRSVVDVSLLSEEDDVLLPKTKTKSETSCL